MFKGSRIYVAGHTGLLGCALLKKLQARGCTDIIIRTHARLDLTRQAAVDRFFKKEKPECVFLAAGLTGGIVANKAHPAKFLHANIAIQDAIFEASIKYGVKRVMFYGSSCMYPRESSQPIEEDFLLSGKIEESSAGYAIAKIAGVLACRSYNAEHRKNTFIALVPNTMYGPHDDFDPERAHVVAALMSKFHQARMKNEKNVVLWGSGKPRREFIFSEDVADASLFVMTHADRLQNRHYNIGTGKDYSIKELAGIMAGIVGYTGRVVWDTTKPDGAPRKLLDSGDFSKLGWKPRITLEEGLRVTYAWYLRHIQRKKTYGSKTG